MNIYVYENDETYNMSPLSSNRATFDIRIGSETFLDRIKRIFPNDSISLFVRDELEGVTKEKHSDLNVNPKEVDEGIWLLGNVIWIETDFKVFPKSETLFYNNNNLIGAFLSKISGNDWLKSRKLIQKASVKKAFELVNSFI